MRKRGHLYTESCSAFRLFNSGGDGIPGLVIDRYGEYLLIQIFEEKVVPDKEKIFESVLSVIAGLPVVPKGILYKRRDETASSQKEYRSELVWGDMPERNYLVTQSGVTAAVNLVEGLNTALFLDMRNVRNELSELYTSGMESMLNLFCYTGMFSVHALRNGLKRCCNVDISGTVLRRAKENYCINGLRVDNRDFICEDSGVFLKKAAS
ncbi:MAG TPA: class I SAM-dependent methyltransferase, partial [Spirochaetota bacterium]|nr:class I SAM-dependent methyltransferase [Spirochaetota bacterium]